MSFKAWKYRKMLVFSTLAFIAILGLVSSLSPAGAVLTGPVNLSVSTNETSYYIREPVQMLGGVQENGAPGTGYVVSAEVTSPAGYPLLFRTVSIGNTSKKWEININRVWITDSSLSANDSAPINSMVNFNVNFTNQMLATFPIVVTGTVFDGNLIPIFSRVTPMTVTPLENNALVWSLWVPEWAYSGKAFAAVSIYSGLPKDGGIPYAIEAQHVFYITRTPGVKYPFSTLPVADASGPGQFGVNFRMPPDTLTPPGNYSVNVVALSASNPIYRTWTSTSFNLLDYAAPPTAAFSYTPLQVYQNMTVTFDASPSSAEGYNDTITSYEWTINDPYNPIHVVKTPPAVTLTHAFTQLGTYTVQLNVTDNEGLWSAITKPIIILPEYNPIANFTWSPTKPVINLTVTFNASRSQVGWSAQISGYAPIVNYTWNFGDGTPINTTTSNTITHKFTVLNNYTVGLTVTDSVGRTNSVSTLIEVANRSQYDLNGDGKIDIKDISIVARAFGTRPGDPYWNPIADINGDGKVDIKDVSAVAKHYGETFP